jgi:Fe-S oxidoreductase
VWSELRYAIDIYPLLYLLWGAVGLYWVALAAAAIGALARARPGRPLERPLGRALAALGEVFLQRGVWRTPLAGAMHKALFGGWLLVLVGFVVTHYLAPRGQPWQQSTLVHALLDVAAVLALGGLLVAGWRRHARREIPASFLDTGLWALLLVTLLAGIAAQGLLVADAAPAWRRAAPVSRALGGLLAGAPEGTLRAAYGWAWSLVHAGLLGMAILLPLTKWRHTLLAPVSLLTRPRPLGRPAPLDLEGPEPFGALGPRDLTRKERLDIWACTRCGRCSAACPALEAGRTLDPLAIIGGLEAARGGAPLALQVGEGALWDCTTCMACVEVCPVGISPLDMILDLRRERVLDAAVFPPALAEVYRGIERRGNPWGQPEDGAADDGAGLPVLGEGEACEVLVWAGCMGRHDPRAGAALRALGAVLRHAGVHAATLGAAEGCCGDPARRTGNEYLWRTRAEETAAVLGARRFERLVSLCPHCVHQFAHEYGDLGRAVPGAGIPAEHATAYLARLAREGRLALPVDVGAGEAPRRVAYHDPCYLARGLGEVRAARDLLAGLPGLALAELPRHGARARCCGAGGGEMWLGGEEAPLEAPRAAEIAASGAETVATACPYCATMLADGLERAGSGQGVYDVVEIVAAALGVSEGQNGERTGVRA